MKRSEINRYIQDAVTFFAVNNFRLPAWATTTPAEWKAMAATGNYNEIINNQLGWDVTDFGKGCFGQEGLLLFTIRNGSLDDGTKGKTYCEKIMISQVNQQTPNHFHWNKMEDIINRAGGDACHSTLESERTGRENRLFIYRTGRWSDPLSSWRGFGSFAAG